MKLNYRDKVILGILLAIVILLLGFFLLIKPKNAEIKTNKETLAMAQQEKDEIDAKISEIKPLQTEIRETYDKTTELTDDFVEYNDIFNGRKVDQYMQHFAEECEVRVETLGVADLSTATLSYYYFTPSFVGEDMLKASDLNGDRQAANNESKAESESLKSRTKESVLVGNYDISVTGEKENIYNYLKAIEEQDETIIINSVALGNTAIGEKAMEKIAQAAAEAGVEVPEATAKINISIYSVYELAEPNLEAD